MAENNVGGNLFRVIVHFNGTFVRHPCGYVGGDELLFPNTHWVGMSVQECYQFVEDRTGEPVEKLYYCVPGMPLATGIRLIEDDVDYAFWLDEGEENGEITLYADNSGMALDEWWDDDMNLVVSEDESGLEDDQGANEGGQSQPQGGNGNGQSQSEGGNGNGQSQSEGGNGNGQSQPQGPVDEIEHDDIIPMDKTKDDAFLSKLCPSVGDNDGNNSESDDELENYAIFNEEVHWKKQLPILGMRFQSRKQLKNMLCNYAVANGYQLCFKKNDTKRLLVLCCKGECPFRLWATWMSEEHSFQIKSLKPDHQCSRNYKLGSIVTYEWIGGHYTREILHRQKLTIRQLRLEVIKKFGIDVSLSQCRRAKQHAMTLIEGTLVEHYAKLWSYGSEIIRTNPGSTVKLEVQSMPDGTNYFKRFYVCFANIKQGWLDGCRRVLGIDGCFLKGLCTGELLCAVGRDANNHIYPVAWAVVGVENKDNWKWFFDLLTDDLELGMGGGLTLMSDQHKGLMEAVKEVLPNAEHRQCARHIASNFKNKFPGVHFENLFWNACNATTEQAFKVFMTELQTLSPPAHKYLMDKDPKTWSRAYYEPGRCCAAVENGLSESFNAVIVDARKKPIISMLEEIRLYIMERMYNLKNKRWSHNVSPAVRQLLNVLKKQQRYWQVLPSGLNQFETRNEGEAYQVDIDRRTCSCRMWQLNGYGCVHSVATIFFLNRDVESYVDPVFCRSSYNETYKGNILPMNGSNMWPETTFTPPLPPKRRKMPGRPAVKRKRGQSEKVGKHRVSKMGKSVVCGACHIPGHNRTTCPNTNSRPSKLRVKRAKRTNNNQEGGSTQQTGVEEAAQEAVAKEAAQEDIAEEAAQEAVAEEPAQEPVAEDPVQEAVAVAEEAAQEPQQNPAAPIARPPRVRTRRPSQRIIKKKLAKNVIGKNGEGNSSGKPVEVE